MTNPANAEMIEGFKDGYDLDAPEPSSNRSASYRHGLANGRDGPQRKTTGILRCVRSNGGSSDDRGRKHLRRGQCHLRKKSTKD